ncbi:MAG: 3-deoxy-manno-octulosonate cytidylyltransferase [Bacteroides sp.]|nr:3-deoxy-manno-octulosonate cytidylyltransferase [Bacteroides sp.]
MKFLALIPARYASTRFPGKPLAMMAGKPMIQRVYERVASVFTDLAVCTDDDRIADAVREFGGNVVMTSPSHSSGTDRCAEAYRNLRSSADVVINIQGDEPFIDPGQLRAVMDIFISRPDTQLATIVRPFSPDGDYADLADPNKPKVVTDTDGNALYFSRSVIPYLRGLPCEQWPSHHAYLTHVGLYGYKADTLQHITTLPRSPLEIAESLEQLRWLQAGYRIATAPSTAPTIGIDTPADLEKSLNLLKL